MKVVITGANGNLGQRIQTLKAFDIIPVRRENWNQLDLLKKGDAKAIIHCAYDLKNNIHERPDTVLESNILSTGRILRLAKEKGISRFIFISSCAVYGDSSNSSEDHPCRPITLNGHTKLFNEELITSFCKANGIDYLILRAFNSYGGDDHFSVIQKLISCAKNKTPFTLLNDGMAERDYIYIGDLARIVCALTTQSVRNDIINIGSGHSVRTIELLEAIEKKFGKIVIEKKQNPNEAIYSRANIRKLKQLMEFTPTSVFDFIQGLSD